MALPATQFFGEVFSKWKNAVDKVNVEDIVEEYETSGKEALSKLYQLRDDVIEVATFAAREEWRYNTDDATFYEREIRECSNKLRLTLDTVIEKLRDHHFPSGKQDNEKLMSILAQSQILKEHVEALYLNTQIPQSKGPATKLLEEKLSELYLYIEEMNPEGIVHDFLRSTSATLALLWNKESEVREVAKFVERAESSDGLQIYRNGMQENATRIRLKLERTIKPLKGHLDDLGIIDRELLIARVSRDCYINYSDLSNALDGKLVRLDDLLKYAIREVQKGESSSMQNRDNLYYIVSRRCENEAILTPAQQSKYATFLRLFS